MVRNQKALCTVVLKGQFKNIPYIVKKSNFNVLREMKNVNILRHR